MNPLKKGRKNKKIGKQERRIVKERSGGILKEKKEEWKKRKK